MYKKTLSACALLLSSMTALYAGTMGEVVEPLPVITPFISGEGLYSWPTIGGYHFNVLSVGRFNSVNDATGWGGRIALGALHPMSDRWTVSGEIGWGYYGVVDLLPAFTPFSNSQVQVTATGKAFDVQMNQYGFDILAGLLYTQPKYDLFIKLGALLQNVRVTINVDPTEIGGDVQNSGLGFRLPGQYRFATTLVNALPELKLGGGYHMNKDWLLNLSWMHAFGSEFSLSNRGLSAGLKNQPVVVGTTALQLRAPTIDVFLFGVEYRFS